MESTGMMMRMMMEGGDDQWSSFNGVSDNHDEEPHILAQILFPTSSYGSDHTNINNEHLTENSLYLPYYPPQKESTLTSSNFYSCEGSQSHYMSENSQQFSGFNDISLSLPDIDFPMSFNCMEPQDHSRDEFSNTHLRVQLECDQAMPEIDQPDEKISSDDSSETKKRSRVSQKGKRNVRSKKSRKAAGSENDERANSEEDSNESEENISEANLKSNVKTRASRGSATDPQSLYARKRRERINERLKTLQKLVPNGTKVDISTMLEEAVNYVNFLQLQIKLLSSEEMWRYAPLAYNGLFPDNTTFDLLTKNISTKYPA